MTSHPALATFISDVSEVVARRPSEEEVTRLVAERLSRLLAEGGEFLEAAVMQPGEDHYVMYPLYVAPDGSFSVASAVWGIGQRTPIHDHGTWGVIGIYQGAEDEIRYSPPAQDGPSAPVRLGAGRLRSGEVVVCCTTDHDLHQVSCGSDVPCVGIHVYGADIGTIERRTYDAQDGAVSTFVSRWATPVA